LQNGGDAFRRGDLSMLAGAELQIMKLRITGRYAIGLSNINDIDNQDKWTTRGFQVSSRIGTLAYKISSFEKQQPFCQQKGFFIVMAPYLTTIDSHCIFNPPVRTCRTDRIT
jgi:hypothetical protein